MSKIPYIIRFYKELNSGNEPVIKWILSLEKKEKKIIGEDLDILEKFWPIGLPLVRCMKDGLWELRIKLTNK